MPIRRGKAGTDLGGQFIGPKSIAQALIRELSARGHAGAAKDLRTNPPKLTAPKKRAISRFKPSERELKGHSRASADASRLRDRIATLDEDLRAPQHEGGRMSHPAERDKARKTRAELQRQLAELEPRVAAGERNRQQNPDMYGDAPTPGDVPDGTAPVGRPDEPAPGVGPTLSKFSSTQKLTPRDVTQAQTLTPEGQRTLDSLGPAGHPAIADITNPENKVRAAVKMLQLEPYKQDTYVSFESLRKVVGDQLTRDQFDGAVRSLAMQPDVTVTPQHYDRGNSATRIPAAVRFGGEHVDHIAIEPPGFRQYTGVVGDINEQRVMGHITTSEAKDQLRARMAGIPAGEDSAGRQLLQAEIDRLSTPGRFDPSPADSRPSAHTPTPPDGTGPVPVVPGAAPKAPRKAAAKVAAVKASKRPASETAALVDASTTAEEAHAHLEGLSVAELRAVAAEMDGVRVRSGKERMRADIVGASKGVVGTIDFAVRAIPSNPSVPKVAKADLPGSAAAKVRAAKAANADVRPDPMAEHMAVQRAAYEVKPFGEPEMPPAAPPKRKAAARVKAAKASGDDLTGADGLSSDPVVRTAQVENRVRQAYRDLRPSGGFAEFADLREHSALAALPRAEQDAALHRLRADSDTMMFGHDQKIITPRDRAAALDVGRGTAGREGVQMMSLRDPSPRPLPPTPRKAAAKVKAAKAAAEPPDAVAAKIRAAASEDEARQYLNGLTLAQLKEVAKLTGGHAPRKAELIDAIVYNGVGFRIESAVLRNR